ncbi:hypothetical protein PILCRDRAFT_6866 [Piloderma croceum F 1598]|uniref:Uncharacterized protein n=1 Tax=Piloderma croceum (strain F 1598) TaxID=765440 RepID=A0A0C3C370_PILCF|nr:hypothetical protein PILCRDRAFT_6866 [Piloderma croceum F 1598]
MSYIHPLGPKPVELNNSIIRRKSDSPYEEPVTRRSSDQLTIRASSTTGLTFAQQLYASALKSPVSSVSSNPAPSNNTHSPGSGNASANPRDLDSRKRHNKPSRSIDNDAPSPPPPVTTARNTYSPQLATYLNTSTNPSNYSNPHEPPSGSTQVFDTPETIQPAVRSPVLPSTSEPTEPAPSGKSYTPMLYNSVKMPQNPHTKSARPHGPRSSSHSSRPPLSDDAPATVQQPVNAGPDSTSAPPQHIQFTDSSNVAPHRMRSYQPTPVSPPPATPLPRSSTFTAGVPAAPNSSRTSTSSSAAPPTLTGHQRARTKPTHASTASVPSPPPPPPPPPPAASLQRTFQMPIPQHHTSDSKSSTPSSYHSPPSHTSPPPVVIPSPPVLASQPPSYPFPPDANQSSPTTFSSPTMSSLPSTPALTASTSSQPPTPLYSPMSPTLQAPAPSRAPVSSQPASKSRSFGRNAMLGVVGGAAAGIIGGAVLNDVLGGDNSGGFDGIIDGMGGGGVSGVDGLLDDVLNAGGTNGVLGGDGGLPQFLDPSAQLSGGLDPTSIFDQINQSNNPYDQYQQQYPQQQQQQTGPDYIDLAHQAYDRIHHAQQQHSGESSSSSGGSAGVPGYAATSGGAPTTYSQAPSAAQYPPQNDTFAGYQAAYNAYHNITPHSQTALHGQTYQTSQTTPTYHPGHLYPPGPTYQGAQQGQPAHHQGSGINATHVKQFAKGAMIAGKILAKVNGVNLGNL